MAIIIDEDGIEWDDTLPEYTGQPLMTEAQAIEASLDREDAFFRRVSKGNRRNPWEPATG